MVEHLTGHRRKTQVALVQTVREPHPVLGLQPVLVDQVALEQALGDQAVLELEVLHVLQTVQEVHCMKVVLAMPQNLLSWTNTRSVI